MSKQTQLAFIEFEKTVKMSPFPYSVRVIVSSDVNQAIMNRPKQVGEHERAEKLVAMHCDDIRGKGIGWLFIPFDLEPWDVAHEAYHAICSMFRYVLTEGEEEELVTYHLSYLVKAILKHMSASIKKRDKPIPSLPCEAVHL